MMAMISGSTYERALISQNFDQMWTRAYQDVLINIETLLPMAKDGNFMVHSGSAKVLKAYIYITLVDVFGDVPKTEALQGTTGVFNPKQTLEPKYIRRLSRSWMKQKTDLAAKRPRPGQRYLLWRRHGQMDYAGQFAKTESLDDISTDPARKA